MVGRTSKKNLHERAFDIRPGEGLRNHRELLFRRRREARRGKGRGNRHDKRADRPIIIQGERGREAGGGKRFQLRRAGHGRRIYQSNDGIHHQPDKAERKRIQSGAGELQRSHIRQRRDSRIQEQHDAEENGGRQDDSGGRCHKSRACKGGSPRRGQDRPRGKRSGAGGGERGSPRNPLHEHPQNPRHGIIAGRNPCKNRPRQRRTGGRAYGYGR